MLAANFAGEFDRRDAEAIPDFPYKRSSVRSALDRLHEQGRLQLVRRGSSGKNGAPATYRVVR